MKFSADQYVEDVLDGEQVACGWVRMACERHVADMEDGEGRGLWFDETAGRMAIAFFSVLHHWKGEWAGEAIELEPWQQFVLWSLFGWKRADGTRRFRTAYLEVARKNGKTTMAAGIGLYLMVADEEPGAEVYSAATKRDQARISHQAAIQMVKRSAHLKKMIRIFKDNLHELGSASKFEPLGRNADSLDGLNCHGVIADEVHAWPTRDMWDVLETSTGARRQPLMLAITTAGFDRHSFCWSLHEYTEKVLDGLVEDDSFFGMIYGLDEEDDWEDEGVWKKANPNLGVSKKWDDMRRKMGRAREMPAALNAFLRLELNMWTQAETRWVPMEAWKRCGEFQVDGDELLGRPCYAGLDLASTTDVSALVYVFPPLEDGEKWRVLSRFWVPDEFMRERVKRDRVSYDVWVRHGYMEATPGNVTDYDFILAQVEKDLAEFEIKELAFDRWGSQKIVTDLQKIGFIADPKAAKDGRGPVLVQFGQGFASMAGPMRELGKLILSGDLAHGDNPVLNWMASNLVAREDAAGNLKPDKERSTEKIDGMVALTLALGRASLFADRLKSVYQERGIRTI